MRHSRCRHVAEFCGQFGIKTTASQGLGGQRELGGSGPGSGEFLALLHGVLRPPEGWGQREAGCVSNEC